jgi:nuclear GTP-binding protein
MLGKIPYYTLPPARNNDDIGEAVIISELGREFNTEELYDAEASYIGNLASVDDYRHVKVPPLPPPKFDEDMLEEVIVCCFFWLLTHQINFVDILLSWGA